MQNLPAVVLAVIVGTLFGFVLRLGTSIQKLSQKMLQSLRRFLLMATGLRMMHLNAFPVADMIPAMLLVMPMSYLLSSLM